MIDPNDGEDIPMGVRCIMVRASRSEVRPLSLAPAGNIIGQ